MEKYLRENLMSKISLLRKTVILRKPFLSLDIQNFAILKVSETRLSRQLFLDYLHIGYK